MRRGTIQAHALGADGTGMSIPEIASAQSNAQVKSDVNIGVLKKVLKQQEAQGRAAVKLIDSTGVSRGANEPGKGRGVDRTA